MISCDLNCDMGEGVGYDEVIMPFITSANIACGYHAGNEATMRRTVLLAKKFGVSVGAHPSYLDREHFGRREWNLGPEQIYHLVIEQITILEKIAAEYGMALHHIKPHGALYNKAAEEVFVAQAIAQAVMHKDSRLILYGLSGSCLISEARKAGLRTASEVFADRTYQNNGSLTPRSQPDALIEQEARSISQVLEMVKHKSVVTVSGNRIPIEAETICIHGDGQHAVTFARSIRTALEIEGIKVRTV